jgi:predicted transcriptional regulator of viral defense system
MARSAAKSKTQAALDLVRERGIVRPRDLAVHKIPADYLDRLHRRGQIERVARGLYAWPDADLGENQTLAEAARQVPRGIICLLSALRFHGLTTQAPHEVWMALGHAANHSRLRRDCRFCRDRRGIPFPHPPNLLSIGVHSCNSVDRISASSHL